MDDCERRHAHRYAIRIPLAFRPLQPEGFPRCSGEIVNISTDGVRFVTHTPLSGGAAVKVYLKLPQHVIGRPSPEWEWTGRVVDVRPLENKIFELGVQFIACGVLDPARQRSDGN